METPTVIEVMNDPSASNWLRESLSKAVERDIVDAVNDAELLSKILNNLWADMAHGG